MKKTDETAIRGWVCRDQPNSFSHKGNLNLFTEKPERDWYDWNDMIYGFFNLANSDVKVIALDPSLFPEITWESEPQEVEITIKIKK